MNDEARQQAREEAWESWGGPDSPRAAFDTGFDAGADWQREQMPDLDRTIGLLREADLLRDNAIHERDKLAARAEQAEASVLALREAAEPFDGGVHPVWSSAVFREKQGHLSVVLRDTAAAAEAARKRIRLEGARELIRRCQEATAAFPAVDGLMASGRLIDGVLAEMEAPNA